MPASAFWRASKKTATSRPSHRVAEAQGQNIDIDVITAAQGRRMGDRVGVVDAAIEEWHRCESLFDGAW